MAGGIKKILETSEPVREIWNSVVNWIHDSGDEVMIDSEYCEAYLSSGQKCITCKYDMGCFKASGILDIFESFLSSAKNDEEFVAVSDKMNFLSDKMNFLVVVLLSCKSREDWLSLVKRSEKR